MRLFCLEVKRVLKSRRTLILIAVALVMSVVMAYLPIAFESINTNLQNAAPQEWNPLLRSALQDNE